MSSENVTYIFLAIIVIVGLSVVVFVSNWADDNSNFVSENQTRLNEACMELGCPNATVFVGDISTKYYYSCLCEESKKINASNLICFASKTEVALKNYIKGYCTNR